MQPHGLQRLKRGARRTSSSLAKTPFGVWTLHRRGILSRRQDFTGLRSDSERRYWGLPSWNTLVWILYCTVACTLGRHAQQAMLYVLGLPPPKYVYRVTPTLYQTQGQSQSSASGQLPYHCMARHVTAVVATEFWAGSGKVPVFCASVSEGGRGERERERE